MTIKADLRHVIYALSDALDLVGVDEVGHGKRVGIMAYECGRLLGLEPEELTYLFDLGMLHDLGVSSTQLHRRIVSEFTWSGCGTHCETGYGLLKGFEPLATLALPVRYHHTPWAELLAGRVETGTACRANLICLTDRVDALITARGAHGALLAHAEGIRAEIRQRSGTLFAPELVELFLEASRSEAFWLMLEPRAIQTFVQDMLSRGPWFEASMHELRQLAQIFSGIVDAKSPFTAAHSLGVAELAKLFARTLGLGDDSCDQIEIAGLLHDVGKLRVPDEILDKPSRLDAQERRTINAHSFETFQILRHIKGFEEITPWAAYHHEEPGGAGYPFRLDANALPVEARLLRVADIFQAMAQDRPYRKGLSREQTLAFLQDLARQGRMESEFVALATSCGEAAMVAARGGAERPLPVPVTQP